MQSVKGSKRGKVPPGFVSFCLWTFVGCQFLGDVALVVEGRNTEVPLVGTQGILEGAARGTW